MYNKLITMILAMHVRMDEVRNNDRGATATEYALLVSLIAVAIVTAVTAFGNELSTFFSGLGTSVGIG